MVGDGERWGGDTVLITARQVSWTRLISPPDLHKDGDILISQILWNHNGVLDESMLINVLEYVWLCVSVSKLKLPQ